MVRAALAGETIGQDLAALPLDQLLQGRLKVSPSGGLFLLVGEDQIVDELSGLADAAVEIDGRQHRLHGVGLDGGPGPAAAVGLALAQL